eukprot:4085864-Heterocapsa_arctica.AAC.1
MSEHPAWENLNRIVHNEHKVNRYAAGALSFSQLLDFMWPTQPIVGRFGLPNDFAEVWDISIPLEDSPKWMIFDAKLCNMPG